MMLFDCQRRKTKVLTPSPLSDPREWHRTERFTREDVLNIEFCLCAACFTERAERLVETTYRSDCRRFIRDVLRGYVVCKGSRIDIGQRPECLTDRDLDNFVNALARAGMGTGTNSYSTAVRAAVSLDGPECQHCLSKSVPRKVPTKLQQGSVAGPSTNPADGSRTPPVGTGRLTVGPDRSERGYRVAHAQKSLSLVFKHLWCHGFLTNPPPICVIDSIILSEAAARGAGTHPIPWTRVASLEAYREHLAICKRAAGGHQIAIWELFVFYGGEPPSDLTEEQLQHAKEAFLLNDAFAARPGSDWRRAIQGTLTDVHRSAFGHNPTWRFVAKMLARAPVHRRHDQLLIDIYSQYESGVRHTEEHFIEDVAHLVAVMNSEFGNYFR